ncbi:MAG TPA: NUDIX domain-containing protein [Desulfobacterales bacterium]|nr:NUDIX domain-containing protein [Desulfobacterales bacterium]
MDNHEKNYPKNIFKYCPGCGSADFIFQTDHSFKCLDCGLHYYINSSASVAALIENADGNLLLTRRLKDPMKGSLDLPGGFVDVLETAEEALKREIKEELNLEIKEFQFFASSPNRYRFDGIVYFTLDLAFLCKIVSFDDIKPDDDAADYIFLPPAQINLEEVGFESIKNIIASYRKQKS